MYYVYILVSLVDGSLYTGQTAGLKERIERHNRGNVRATRSRAPFELGYFETFATRQEAMWREWKLKKKYNTERKKKLVAEFDKRKIQVVLGL